jgi:hypothetical protein
MLGMIMGLGAIVVVVVLVYQLALSDLQGAQHERREDTILVGAEAMLERYAAKLTIDPYYYRHYVDEAELPRRCSDVSSSSYGVVVQPGNAWIDDCTAWEYEEPDSFFEHPLLLGNEGVAADDMASLLTVNPNGPSGGIELTVVSQQDDFSQARAITAEIKPEAVSEFAFLIEDDLRFGSGIDIEGKIYTGGDLDFRQNPVRGVVHRNIFAEGGIGRTGGYGTPILADGAQAYDGVGDFNDIREVYAEPISFDKFWDDLALFREVACGGGGLCLSREYNPALGLTNTPTAWLLEPMAVGSVGRIQVSAAYSNNSSSCLSSEEWWWRHSHNATWVPVGTFDIPANGVVWVEGHTVIGLPGQTSTIAGQVSIYAGSLGAPRNIIVGSDIVYATGTSGTDVLGLIASDELIISPEAVGPDVQMTISAAILTQGGSAQVARSCGGSGNVLLPTPGGIPSASLTVIGSRAGRVTGDIAAHFGTRNYLFDVRLESLRPPLFPVLHDSWHYVNWSEITIPCWAQEEGCP